MLSLDDYIRRLDALPPAPRILPQLLALLREDDVPPSRIVELITFDPALTAKILQRCNTAAVGLPHPVHDLSQAVPLLGYNETYRLTAMVIGQSTLGEGLLGYGIAAGELWRHSVATAVAARLLAQSLEADENLVFTAALLHDVGKLVLSRYLSDSLSVITRETEQSHLSFLEVERLLLGVDHAEVGGRLLSTWNFPENLVKSVQYHHDPVRAHPFDHLAAYVHAGDVIAHLCGHGHGDQAFAVRVRSEVLQWLELSSRELESYVVLTESTLSAMAWFTPKPL